MKTGLTLSYDSDITISLSQPYAVQNISFIVFTVFYEEALL